MYQSTVALLQLRFDHSSEGSSGIYNHIQEVYLNAASQSFELLQQFSRTFGIFVMPPTFQYFASVVSHVMSLSVNQSKGEMNPTTPLQSDLRLILSRLKEVWASRKATPTTLPTQTYNENLRMNGIQATPNSIAGCATINNQQWPDLAASVHRENKPRTIDQLAQPGYHMQVSDTPSNGLFKNVMVAENQGSLQSPQASTEPVPIWAPNQGSNETYSRTPTSTSATHPIEVTTTSYQTGSTWTLIKVFHLLSGVRLTNTRLCPMQSELP